MGFNTYKRMTVAELRDILAQAIEVLDDYPDDTKIIERANTYGCPTPYLSTPKGFYPLNDLEFDVEESKHFVVKEKSDDYKMVFSRIFPFGSINDKVAYKTMYEIGKIVKKYIDKDVGYDSYYLLSPILIRLRAVIYAPKDYKRDWMLNAIDDIIMRYFDDEDLGTQCVREILAFLKKEGW